MTNPAIVTRPDLGNLSPNMAAALDLLTGAWEESDAEESEDLSWVRFVKLQTVKALRRRGIPILARRDYYGNLFRLADPHPSGLGY